MASSHLITFPKALSPNVVTLGIGDSTYEFEEGHNSVHNGDDDRERSH